MQNWNRITFLCHAELNQKGLDAAEPPSTIKYRGKQQPCYSTIYFIANNKQGAHTKSQSKMGTEYSRVSSLYGPGTVGCWLLTTLSVFISWTFHLQGSTRDIITADFIATLILPTVAALHIIYQIDRAPISIRDILSDENTEWLPWAAAIEAPLTVCESFFAFSLPLLRLAINRSHKKRAILLVIVSLSSILVSVIIAALAEGSISIVQRLQRPFRFAIYHAMTCAIPFILLPGQLLISVDKRMPSRSKYQKSSRGDQFSKTFVLIFTTTFGPFMAYNLLLLLFGIISGSGLAVFDTVPKKLFIYFIPYSGISWKELDQATALFTGFVIVSFTWCSIFNSWKNMTEFEDDGLAETEVLLQTAERRNGRGREVGLASTSLTQTTRNDLSGSSIAVFNRPIRRQSV
jgi:hypothetical protein